MIYDTLSLKENAKGISWSALRFSQNDLEILLPDMKNFKFGRLCVMTDIFLLLGRSSVVDLKCNQLGIG